MTFFNVKTKDQAEFKSIALRDMGYDVRVVEMRPKNHELNHQLSYDVRGKMKSESDLYVHRIKLKSQKRSPTEIKRSWG